MAYFVYILQSERDGSYYIGHTSNLEERLKRHNERRSLYTRGRPLWKLVYHEALDSKSEAAKREQEIKSKKNRGYILQLVGTSPGQ